jgi:hypothetical protein
MTNVKTRLRTLLQLGVRIHVVGEDLDVVDPAARLTNYDWEWLANHKPAIRAHLEAQSKSKFNTVSNLKPGWSFPTPDARVNGDRRCQSDRCLGWVRVRDGRGTCDHCGLAHIFCEPGWHARVFGTASLKARTEV